MQEIKIIFSNCFIQKQLILPDDRSVRSETFRSLVFQKHYYDSNDNCMHLLVKTADRLYIYIYIYMYIYILIYLFSDKIQSYNNTRGTGNKRKEWRLLLTPQCLQFDAILKYVILKNINYSNSIREMETTVTN